MTGPYNSDGDLDENGPLIQDLPGDGAMHALSLEKATNLIALMAICRFTLIFREGNTR